MAKSSIDQILHDKGYRLNEKKEWYLPNGMHSRLISDEAPIELGTRIRQSRSTLNKLEMDFFGVLLKVHGAGRIKAQAMRFQLANGLWYKPDFVVFPELGFPLCYEVKGPHAFRGGLENLKMAATQHPMLNWWLAWKEGEFWKSQNVLPTLAASPQ